LAAHPEALFSIPHFDGYAAVLVRLPEVLTTTLAAVLEDGWLAHAPAAVAKGHLMSKRTSVDGDRVQDSGTT
jgi:hypothetical protein